MHRGTAKVVTDAVRIFVMPCAANRQLQIMTLPMLRKFELLHAEFHKFLTRSVLQARQTRSWPLGP